MPGSAKFPLSFIPFLQVNNTDCSMNERVIHGGAILLSSKLFQTFTYLTCVYGAPPVFQYKIASTWRWPRRGQALRGYVLELKY